MSKERKFTLYEGGGVGSFGEPKPKLRLIPGSNEDEPELELPSFLPENSSSKTEILLEQLAQYNTDLLVSQDRLLESGNSNAIRLHCLITTIHHLTAPSHLSSQMPNGDIEYFVDNFVTSDEYSSEEARARGIVVCGAADMILDILESQEYFDNNGAKINFLDHYPSPTRKNLGEKVKDAQDDLAYLIEQLVQEATGDEMTREEIINYFYRLKEITVQTIGLYENEETPNSEEFLKHWRVLIVK